MYNKHTPGFVQGFSESVKVNHRTLLGTVQVVDVWLLLTITTDLLTIQVIVCHLSYKIYYCQTLQSKMAYDLIVVITL